eukprot:TRINITY_DN372_c0_g3_i2.p1 TRINITY_DN372_c0_g3~~TRINITY_DN372_c0_g3_i2.p1  ORF type:complete len:146 (-),score=51.27 TRINITY_DN372_c0_g3_i2:130-567(-)
MTFLAALRAFLMIPYYIVDNWAWLCKIDVVKGDKVWYAKNSIAWWFSHLVTSLAYDLLSIWYQCTTLDKLNAKKREAVDEKEQDELNKQITACHTNIRTTCIDLLKIGGDLGLATSTLFFDFSRMTTGLCGSVSSLVGWYQIWPA